MGNHGIGFPSRSRAAGFLRLAVSGAALAAAGSCADAKQPSARELPALFSALEKTDAVVEDPSSAKAHALRFLRCELLVLPSHVEGAASLRKSRQPGAQGVPLAAASKLGVGCAIRSTRVGLRLPRAIGCNKRRYSLISERRD